MKVMFLVIIFLGMHGCTWVKLSSAGAQVEVLKQKPSDCRRLGRTTSITKAELLSVDRNAKKIVTELETLARNHAVEMGANAIIAESPMTPEGKQTFIVYDCP